MNVNNLMAELERKHPGENEYLQAVREVLESIEEVYNLSLIHICFAGPQPRSGQRRSPQAGSAARRDRRIPEPNRNRKEITGKDTRGDRIEKSASIIVLYHTFKKNLPA